MAVSKAMEVLGEAARRIPDHIRECHPDIPWRDIVGMRNTLAHAYSGVDLHMLFATARQSVPLLLKELPAVIATAKEFG
ncbi:conserved hypothetical protein [Magnetospirillum sp. UT-4]|nr:conserved hypothetical protein [Magnetospirillum sp. UT-4]